MFDIVNRRLLRRLLYALVAAQIFLSAPVASAFASIASAGQEEHCAGMQHAQAGSEECPCCPEGESGTAACLSACAASLGAVSSPSFVSARAVHARVAQSPEVHLALAAEPPLNPPPIY